LTLDGEGCHHRRNYSSKICFTHWSVISYQLSVISYQLSTSEGKRQKKESGNPPK